MFAQINSYSGPQSPFDSHNPSSLVASYAPSSLVPLIHFSSGARVLRWRFDVLTFNRRWSGSDGTPLYKGDLTPYVSHFTLTNNSSNAVSRSLQLDMVETAASQTVTISGGVITSAGLDYLNDLISPVALIQRGPNEWLHMRLGVFAFSRPQVQVPGYAVVRSGTMPDLTSLVQKSFAFDPTNIQGVPLTLPKGAKVLDCINSLLVNDPANVPTNPPTLNGLPGCALGDNLPSNAPIASVLTQNGPGDWPTTTDIPATLASDYQINEGESYLDVINHLLRTICCFPLQADDKGIFRIQRMPLVINSSYPDVPIPDFASASPVWTYDTTTQSIVSFGLTEDIAADDIANVIQVRIEDGIRTPYLATAINTDAASPYNVNNWAGSGQKRRIVKVIDDGAIPQIDATTGQNYALQFAARELLQASWLTDEVQLPIATNPVHCGGMDHDVVKLNIYQGNVAAGTAQNVPVIALSNYPGLVVTEQFMIDGYTITATMPTPGSGSNLVGNAGVTTDLTTRESKQGSTMTLTCHRVTHTLSPTGITFVGSS